MYKFKFCHTKEPCIFTTMYPVNLFSLKSYLHSYEKELDTSTCDLTF